MKDKFRCGCPITTGLDIIGDKWTLIIVRDMLLKGKKTFKDFSDSKESIASNILSTRLKKLEEYKIITKEKHPTNKKTNIYRLTEKGISLAPVLIELLLWTCDNMLEFNTEVNPDDRVETIKNNKSSAIAEMQDSYRHNVSQFTTTYENK